MAPHHRFSRRSPSWRALLLVGATVLVALLAAGACGSDSGNSDSGNSDSGNSDSIDNVPTTDSGSDATRPSIAGPWDLEAVTIDGTDVPIPPTARVALEIEQGRISGQGGCNSFGGQIDAADDGRLALIDLSWTEMGCEFLEFETIYLPALAKSTAWSVSPTGLTFLGPDSELRYRAGPAPVHLPLSGIDWRFDTVFSGEGVGRTASTPDMTRAEVVLRIAEGTATLASSDCGTVTIAIDAQEGRDGAFIVADNATGQRPQCDDASSNLLVAFDAMVASTGFMIDQQRLTLIGLPGETVGFIGDQ